MTASPIPKPQVLDADRSLRDDKEHELTQGHRSRAEVLDIALHESCAYAEQLWQELNGMRRYLLECLRPDASAASGTAPAGAAPDRPRTRREGRTG